MGGGRIHDTGPTLPAVHDTGPTLPRVEPETVKDALGAEASVVPYLPVGLVVSLAPKYEITEGVESVFHYHLSPVGNPFHSLCGRQTISREMPLKAWGMPSDHIPQSWCKQCAVMAGIGTTED